MPVNTYSTVGSSENPQIQTVMIGEHLKLIMYHVCMYMSYVPTGNKPTNGRSSETIDAAFVTCMEMQLKMLNSKHKVKTFE